MKNCGVEKWIFDEANLLSMIMFHFREIDSHVELTQNISRMMKDYHPHHVLSGPALYRNYKPEEIYQILELLTPNAVVEYQ